LLIVEISLDLLIFEDRMDRVNEKRTACGIVTT